MDKRNTKGQWQPGTQGGPGRKRSGRNQALALVDKICEKKKNLKTLLTALQKEFDKDPIAFYKTIILPLAPKQTENEAAPRGYASMSIAETISDMDKATLGDISTANSVEKAPAIPLSGVETV